MTSDPTDWHQVLARVSGQLVRGEQRVSTQELFTKLGVPVTDQACRRLQAGGGGGGGEDAQRLLAASNGSPAGDRAGGTGGGSGNNGAGDSLAPELERVTRLALEKMTQILKIPTDRGDGNLLRAVATRPGPGPGSLQLMITSGRGKPHRWQLKAKRLEGP